MPVKKLLKIVKSNELNQSGFNDVDLSSYRVLLHIITKVNAKKDENCRRYSLSALEYSEEFKISKNMAYKILKKSVQKLARTVFSLQNFKYGNDEALREIPICCDAYYVDNSGKIDIEFNEKIMPHISNIKNRFTMYNLCEISGFNSVYTTRLYELLMQYKTQGFFSVSINDLRHILDCKNCHKKYNDFKRFGFGHAVNEINSTYEINLKFKEFKNGKSVDRLEFSFKKTTKEQVYDPVTKKVRNQLTRPKTKKKKIEKQEKNPREAFSELAEKLRINKK
jgi:plasmid replication initiation protein